MKLFKFLSILLFTIIISSCDNSRDENEWLVGTSPDNPPYEYIEDGKVVGFDIDVINEIGKHLGKKITIQNMEFHNLLAALSSNSLDLSIAGFSITSDRKTRVDFSVPYTSATVALLYKKKSKIDSLSDLNGKKVGAQLGTIWSLIAHDLALKYKCNVSALSNNLLLVEELKSGSISAVVLEEAQAKKFTKINSQLEMFLLNDFSSSFAIAFPKGSKIKTNVDHTIKTLHRNGTIDKLKTKWGIK